MGDITHKPESSGQHEQPQAKTFDPLALYEQSMVRITARPPMIPTNGGLVVSPDSVGTGFFVKGEKPNSCRVVTDNHVTRDNYVIVTMPDGQSKSADIELGDPKEVLKHDIAILKVNDVNNSSAACKGLPLASDKEANNYIGKVAVISKRNGQPLLLEGQIAGKANFETIQEGAPNQVLREVFILNLPGGDRGDSGAAVIATEGKARGKVVGVIEGGRGDSAWAIPVSELHQALHSLSTEKK